VSDLAEIGRVSIGVNEFGLTEAQSKRLRGESADEVRADARAMREELRLEPIEPERARDDGGRYAAGEDEGDMNRLIREASGRTA
jgi:hypothetical protein